jgi:hypothetical protein
MALTGQLDNVSVGDVLHLLSSSAKSGKLTMSQPGGEGVIVLRRGKIIYAASNSLRETLGSMLLSRDLVSQEQLTHALKEQNTSDVERRLGAILVDSGVLSRNDLERVVGEQIQRVLAEFLDWKTGFFRFDRLDVPDHGEVEVGAPDFLIEQGLPADRLLLDLARQLADEDSDYPPLTEGENGAATQAAPPKPPLMSLKSIMAEIRSPACTSEVTTQILDYAQGLVNRGFLFSAGPQGFSLVAHFGIESASDSNSVLVRSTKLPLGEPSILREAIARKSVYVGPLEGNAVNRELVRRIGGVWPREVLAAPLIVSGRVVLIFCGDNLPTKDLIGETEGFDLVLMHAGLAIEKALLEQRLAHAENLRRKR